MKRPIHPRGGKNFGNSVCPRARAGRVRPGVSYDKDAPASSLPNSAAMTSQLQRLPRKHRVVPVECANPDCRARYVAVLTALIRRIGFRTALNAVRHWGPGGAVLSIPCSQ